MKPAWDTWVAVPSNKKDSKYTPLFLRNRERKPVSPIVKVNLILVSAMSLQDRLPPKSWIQALEGKTEHTHPYHNNQADMNKGICCHPIGSFILD